MILYSALKYSKATVLCPFPGSPAPAYVHFKVNHSLSLSSAELRGIRDAVSCPPLRGFDVVEKQGYDLLTKNRWVFSYVVQRSGPAVSNFSIARDIMGFRVSLDDGVRTTAEWRRFLTVSRAVAAIRRHVERGQDAPGLAEHGRWLLDGAPHLGTNHRPDECSAARSDP